MSRLHRWSVVVAALVLSLTACERRPANVFPETAALEWETARNSGDADAMAALHTENAQVLPPNAPVVEGRAAIRTYFRNLFEQRAAPAAFDVREIIVFGNFAYRQGIYSVTLADGNTEYGKFIQLWKRDNGGWRIHRQMWSRNGLPLAPASDISP
ncbi:MAG TPA: SgcJ/EcaC family oxidoreductase [Steroidobacteraceae bacterium]